ncbi:MAG: ABC transporter permease [Candidatus Omnitrophica bacterium]|nr:ABC transporter permease [Candidatus Omnitrophota bacterium]
MLKGLFEHRSLIYQLAVRDLKIRYRKPILSFFWMLIIPISTAFIYKVLFSDFMRVSNGSYPFFIHLLTALLPWTYFASSLQTATLSILSSKNIINQISFPKYLLPVSVVAANLINFLPTLLVLSGFFVVFHIKIGWLIFLLPAVILIHTALITGLSFAVSALQVIHRDIEYVVQILLTALFFLTPGVYTLDQLTERASPLFVKIYMLNPLVGILNLYRVVFIGQYIGNMPEEINLINILVVPVLFSISALFMGYYIFHKLETKFSDYLNI